MPNYDKKIKEHFSQYEKKIKEHFEQEVKVINARKDFLSAGAFLKSQNYSTMDLVDEVYGLEDMPTENKK
jgi:hypothetical protein